MARVSPRHIVPILVARWRCGNSFALLSTIGSIRFGARIALHDEEGVITFAQLHGQSLALAARLSEEFQVGPGSQVALVGRNHRGFVLGLLACTRLGADVLPLSADLPAAVMEKILARQEITLLLHDSDLEESLQSVSVAVARTSFAVPTGEVRPEPGRVERGGELIVLTSGTSGISKGIRRRPTLGQVLPLVAGLVGSLPIRMHRPVVLAIPLYHGYGIATLAMSLALGSPLHLGRRYEIAPLMERLDADASPLLVTVPTLLSRWLPLIAKSTAPRPAGVITGSAPLDAALCTAVLDAVGPVLFNLYGSTEAGLIALAVPETLRQAPGSVGKPLPGNQVRLLDLSGATIAVGEVGRIFVKGPFVLSSREDGWRDTGDLGRVDVDGHLFVCGRGDAMIVSGGENVYPHEVEILLGEHPSVADCAVLVVDDAEFGRRMTAVVAPRAGSSLEESAVKVWLKERLERHKVPRTVHVLPYIPRNALGKIDRLALDRLMTLT